VRSDSSSRTRPNGTAFLIGLAAGGVVVGLGIGAYYASGSSSFAAFLALLGVAVTAALSFVATRQSNKRLEQEHDDDRERLRLDAAMRAGSLFTGSKESPTCSASAASGLLALTKLDHTELAVALLVDLWSAPLRDWRPNSIQVSNETAILVIDAALRDNRSCSNASLIAAELLCRNAKQLDAGQSLHWPSSIDGRWLPSLSPRTKLLLLDGLVSMTMTSAAHESALRSLAVRLYGIWFGDNKPHVKGCVGFLIKAILPTLQTLNYKNFMHGEMEVTIEQLEAAADQAQTNPDEYLARLVKDRGKGLQRWAVECRESLGVGALGDSQCPEIPLSVTSPMASH
jgi:hypothetical protein